MAFRYWNSGEIREPYASAINYINQTDCFKFAVDVPSGLDPQTGETANIFTKCDMTVTFHKMKQGIPKRKDLQVNYLQKNWNSTRSWREFYDSTSIQVGNMQNFTYIVEDEDTSEAIIIDPSWDLIELEMVIKRNDLKIKYIVNTHHHFDHTIGNEAMAESTKPNHSTWISELKHDITVKDGDFIEFGNSKLKVIHTPGHSKIAFVWLVMEKFSQVIHCLWKLGVVDFLVEAQKNSIIVFLIFYIH